MTTVRAKFRCVDKAQSVYRVGFSYTFAAQYDHTTPEDQRYAKATPQGELKMLVDNPAVDFELGAYYYIDLVRADVQE
jgi:hypothetical protein